MKLALAALLAIGCSGLPEPCSEEGIAAQIAPIVAECKLRREAECKNYDVLDECPLMQECDSRLDRVGAGCHD